MHAVLTSSFVASLDSAALARRLGELAGDERRVQADFLLHLQAFDRRRGYLDAGHSSLWDFCLKALHLREGAAGRRIAAMRVLRRFPVLEGALREGRLCLSTLGLLGQVLTEENLHEVVERAAFRTRAEVDRLVASLQARAAPKDGVRKLAATRQMAEAETTLFAEREHARDTGAPESPTTQSALNGGEPAGVAGAQPVLLASPSQPVAPGAPLAAAGASPRNAPAPLPIRARPELRPVSEESYSLRVTLDAAFKGELDQLRQLLSHKVPTGDLAAVLREAVRCAIEKHGKRRGAVAPARKAAPPSRPSAAALPAHESTQPLTAVEKESTGSPLDAAEERGTRKPESPGDRRPKAGPRPAIPAATRREVWARDGGQCAWRGSDSRRCESRWQLEFDHVVPVALGGLTTAANLRLACRAHNGFLAEQVFGREHMARFPRGATRQGEFAIASGGGG
ncbi:MAG TPA: HNH endonuclease [Anaeromyxobacteraceae bacterium]|jgi:hypothetical protein|nr:HNH endonuclease [Anaeromyxobacteraceae bacterium]